MIKVIKSGLYSTIQDLGRFGFENYGVPISGSMDQFSSIISNKLLGNNDNDAVMEITMTGPVLKFLEKTKISITGADISPSINDNPVKLNIVHNINKGDFLSFGKLKYGIRSYLSVIGGFLTKEVMGSKSMYPNVTKSFRITNGEYLKIKSLNKINTDSKITHLDYLEHFKSNKIKVYKGPEFDRLSNNQKNDIFKKQFTISNDNNRMAFQLNESFKNQLKPIITSLVMQGTVQLTTSGKLIILMRDNQTCGGYPRVLQLNESAINKLSQKYMNNEIKFELIEN
jgi:biotin-dependent carboxylase-like uncharacterized protein|tara:strand:- start:117 stop:968 length:852 start_codon:yes stop_codon:yes gene_type:complete